MKIYISYFYNIRFFPKNLLPVSTAVWNPKWYENGNELFLDKRGVINGVSLKILSPESIYDSQDGCENCKYNKNTKICKFMKDYREYIYSLDFNDIYNILLSGSKSIGTQFNYPDIDMDICLMVYEKPDNPCSERSVLIDWFKDHGVELVEWNKDLVNEYQPSGKALGFDPMITGSNPVCSVKALL